MSNAERYPRVRRIAQRRSVFVFEFVVVTQAKIQRDKYTRETNKRHFVLSFVITKRILSLEDSRVYDYEFLR